ncbi:serine hydrolase domain-containing protein [Rhodococcus sp. NPDC057135]|uniref:serine hydrolase domain-containing protein n=1 Tax=Rhodococcus sp. NPDC057135 TaxID=3346028 RepID=UPI003631DEA5
MSTKLPADLLNSPKWQQLFDELSAKYAVPGAQVGVLALGEDGEADVRVMTTGVTSLKTKVEVDADTLFQIGSITKIWTTTLIMQLVDEGALTLDTPVVEVLPEFAIADAANTKEITVRHLLTHTSGIDGDLFVDTGDGDDSIEKYVAELATAISVTPAGGHLSYSNAGFVVAGRIVEVLRGQTWDEALVDKIYRPLGLTHVITKPKEAPLFRTAVGHLANPDRTSADKVLPSPRWGLPRSIGPAGTIAASMDSLLAFGAAHVRDGLGLTGERILSEKSAREMRTLQVDLSDVSTVDRGWGVGWILSDWGGVTSAHHGGATIGQIAQLHTFPELGLAIGVLTNSRGGSALAHDIESAIGTALGLTYPEPRTDATADEIDLSWAVGVYESTVMRIELTRADDGGFVVQTTAKVQIDGEPDSPPLPVVPLSASRFLVTIQGSTLEAAHVSIDDDEYLYLTRLYKRVTR